MNILAEDAQAHNPMISKDVFLGFMWAGVCTSTLFVTFRLSVRWKVFRKIDWDDGLLVATLIMLWASSAGIQSQIDGIYVMFRLANWALPSSPEDYREFLRAQRAQIPAILFFFLERYSVKLSFLIFFRRLFYHVHRVKVWWWIILIITTCSLPVCLGLVPWKCLSGDLVYIALQCTTPQSQHRQMIALDVSSACDVVTDCLITTIPILGLYNTKLPTRQKVALSAMFSLILVVVAFAITRVVAITATKKLLDTTWYFFWTQLEISIANIVACLCTFRQLFLLADFGASGNFIGGVWYSIKSKVQGRQARSLYDEKTAFYSETSSRSSANSRKKWRVPSLQLSGLSRWTSSTDSSDLSPTDKNIYVSYDVAVEHDSVGLYYPAKAKVVCSSACRFDDYDSFRGG